MVDFGIVDPGTVDVGTTEICIKDTGTVYLTTTDTGTVHADSSDSVHALTVVVTFTLALRMIDARMEDAGLVDV